ncbi:MAG: hypothetical protein ABID61_00260, partial [Candidatus Micrarchaeota archaeon]
ELPYPPTSDCVVHNDTAFVAKSCAMLPEACKVKRLVPPQNQDATQSLKCPLSCKIIPPLKSDCRSDPSNDDLDDGDGCLDSSYDCRMAKSNAMDWRPTKENVDGDVALKCLMAAGCTASMTATQSCVYVVPPTGLCRDLCGGCPSECRITGAEVQLPPSCIANVFACLSCPEGCRVSGADLLDKKVEATAAGKCLAPGSGCEANRLIISNSPPLPYNYNHGSCDYDVCPVEYRIPVPRSACEMCIAAEEQYTYQPPINPRCPDLCKPSDRAPAADPSSLTKIGPDGLVGKPMIQDVSKYMIPVYLLPLFNIVATFIFIKSLSQFLGGDIEIPGISKVF